MSSTAADILKKAKIRDLGLEPGTSVSPETPLEEVFRRLTEERKAAVVVCQGGLPVGIFTQRDVLYGSGSASFDAALPVSEVMTREPTCLTADQPLGKALEVMIEGGYRQIPLVDGEGRFTHLLRSRDVLRYVAGFFPEAVLNLPPRLHQTLAGLDGG